MHPTLDLQQLKHAINAVIEPGGSQMSLADRWIKDVLDAGPDKLTTRAVALLLAREADGDMVDCTQAELAGALSSSPETISRHLTVLAEAGWVEKVRTKHRCTYRLTSPEPPTDNPTKNQSDLTESQSDPAQNQSDPTKDQSVPTKNQDPTKNQSDPTKNQSAQKENKEEKVPPHPPKRRNKRKTTSASAGAREAEPHPDRNSEDLSQWILVRLQEFGLQPNTMTPMQVIDRLNEGPLPKDLYRSYLVDDIADKAERTELKRGEDGHLRPRQALKYIGQSSDAESWLDRRSRTQSGKRSTSTEGSIDRGFFDDIPEEQQRSNVDLTIFD